MFFGCKHRYKGWKKLSDTPWDKNNIYDNYYCKRHNPDFEIKLVVECNKTKEDWYN